MNKLEKLKRHFIGVKLVSGRLMNGSIEQQSMQAPRD